MTKGLPFDEEIVYQGPGHLLGKRSLRQQLRIVETELEQTKRPSPLWDEVMRLLLSEPLTDSGDDGKMLTGEEEEDED